MMIFFTTGGVNLSRSALELFLSKFGYGEDWQLNSALVFDPFSEAGHLEEKTKINSSIVYE